MFVSLSLVESSSRCCFVCAISLFSLFMFVWCLLKVSSSFCACCASIVVFSSICWSIVFRAWKFVFGVQSWNVRSNVVNVCQCFMLSWSICLYVWSVWVVSLIVVSLRICSCVISRSVVCLVFSSVVACSYCFLNSAMSRLCSRSVSEWNGWCVAPQTEQLTPSCRSLRSCMMSLPFESV